MSRSSLLGVYMPFLPWVCKHMIAAPASAQFLHTSILGDSPFPREPTAKGKVQQVNEANQLME